MCEIKVIKVSDGTLSGQQSAKLQVKKEMIRADINEFSE